MISPKNPNFAETPADASRPESDYHLLDASAPPEVSIITPYLNGGEEFRESMRAVAKQTLRSWEWIIVDDKSTEPSSIQLLRECENADSRVRVIRRDTNGGPAAARNTGIRQARADLLFFLDSDDLIEPTALEKCAWYLKTRPGVGFVKGYSVGFGAHEYLWREGFHSGTKMLEENLVTVTTMIRRSVLNEIGEFDESFRSGLEDWELWIRCAANGFWGNTIPEFLDWYRRRDSHADNWPHWDGSSEQDAFRRRLATRFPRLFDGTLPIRHNEPNHTPFTTIPDVSPLQNQLRSDRPSILMVLPWLRMGGSDKWNLDLVKQLRQRGWNVTIATTLDGTMTWGSEFSRLTSDIHALHNFVLDKDAPSYLRYLIESRKPDIVMFSNSWHSYHFLPYLRAVCPDPTYVDYNHMEEEWWHNGGHPRRGVGMQDQLDLNMVTSEHLKNWMVSKGADPERIEVSYINADPNLWKRDPRVREQVRSELGIGDEPMILFAGRICKQKQPNVLAGTIKLLVEHRRNFKIVVAGDGEDGPWLRAFIKKHNLWSHVIMPGEVSSDRVRELMSAADIYFLPSMWEGIALSIYEAMSMSLAVVGAIVGGQAELVTAETGILLPKADEQSEIAAYADALGSLIDDPQRIKVLAQAARERIETHFTLDQMGQRMTELFEIAAHYNRTEPRQRLSKGLAKELATHAVEFFHLQRLCDELWIQRESSRKEREQLSGEIERLRMDPPVSPSPQAALAELAEIERSKAWRAVLGLKRTPLYKALGRYKYGPGWDLVDANESPATRLERMKRSRSYRYIVAIKASRPYRIYKSKTKRGVAR